MQGGALDGPVGQPVQGSLPPGFIPADGAGFVPMQYAPAPATMQFVPQQLQA